MVTSGSLFRGVVKDIIKSDMEGVAAESRDWPVQSSPVFLPFFWNWELELRSSVQLLLCNQNLTGSS